MSKIWKWHPSSKESPRAVENQIFCLGRVVIFRFLIFLMIFFSTKAAKSWPESFFDWFGARFGPSGWYWTRIFIFWKLLAGWPRPLRPINLPLWNDIEKLNFARNSKMIENFPDLECWPILGQGHFSCKRSSCPSTKTSSDPEKSFLECFWALGQGKNLVLLRTSEYRLYRVS